MSAKAGDTVKIHYTGTLTDGTQFDSSAGREPLEFTLGSGQVIPGFDDGVTGMNVGESKTIHIPAAQAYGDKREDMLITVNRAQVPEDIEVQLGMGLTLQGPDGRPTNVKVVDITEETLTLDANHQLAGEDLTFALELVAIN